MIGILLTLVIILQIFILTENIQSLLRVDKGEKGSC